MTFLNNKQPRVTVSIVDGYIHTVIWYGKDKFIITLHDTQMIYVHGLEFVTFIN